ncbi:MAG TPA: M23 family metallopeptidase [Candidatus Dormibacteraeota bacterium]|nr:M23 family metallopeptidase [Candidatus Dormibacteraeota bacterium]
MTVLAGGRLVFFAWSWRRPLVIAGVAMLSVPLMLAGLVIKAQQASAGQLQMPVHDARLTQAFGCTALAIEPWSAECPTHHFHSGIDLAGAIDTPIYAATAGEVRLERERGGYGLYIIIVRDPRLSTLYGHLDLPLVQRGDVVAAGQAIALMGSTGNSTGPHLHFEVRIAGVPVDPLPLLGLKGGGRQLN